MISLDDLKNNILEIVELSKANKINDCSILNNIKGIENHIFELSFDFQDIHGCIYKLSKVKDVENFTVELIELSKLANSQYINGDYV